MAQRLWQISGKLKKKLKIVLFQFPKLSKWTCMGEIDGSERKQKSGKLKLKNKYLRGKRYNFFAFLFSTCS